MAKKILSIVLLVISLVCVFTSCGDDKHTHSYGEWKTVKEPTASEKGSEERVCGCGEKETRDIPKIETKSISALECYNEITNYLNETKKLSSISVVEGNNVYTIYSDGEKTLLYRTYGKYDEGRTESWRGKVGSEYVAAFHYTDEDGSSEKYYEVISKSEFDDTVEDYMHDIFDPAEDVLKCTERDGAECLKTTAGKKITYVVKYPDKEGDMQTATLETNNGVITKADEATYSTDVAVAMPDLSSFEKK